MSPVKKRASTATKSERTPTTEELASMIAEAAYYKAEQRGFTGGSPEQDWWEAEKEIEAMLAVPRGRGNGRRDRTPRGQAR
jgi:hypothetical protein